MIRLLKTIYNYKIILQGGVMALTHIDPRRTGQQLLVLVLIFMFIGCGSKRYDYDWVEYVITPERINSSTAFEEQKSIKVTAGDSDKKEFLMGEIGPHEYYGNLQILSDAIVQQFTEELYNRNVEVHNTSTDKSIEITVKHAAFERGMWKIAVTLEFDVKIGPDHTISYTVRNSSPSTVNRTYDGAVALSVIELLNDPKIVNYINE